MKKNIFDCFLFYNELELLELRLMELYDFVDYFILVEADRTFKNNEKELFFEKNKEKYAKFLDKIIHVKFKSKVCPPEMNIWTNEIDQRNAMMDILNEKAKKGDKIILSDVDEIPNIETIKKYLDCDSIISFEQNLYYYFINCKLNITWYGTTMANFGQFNTIQELREIGRSGFNAVKNGGWHYSYMGGIDKIINKVKNTSDGHLIKDLIGNKNEIDFKIKNQKDLWNRKEESYEQNIVNITDDSPKKINDFLLKYPNFLFQVPNFYKYL